MWLPIVRTLYCNDYENIVYTSHRVTQAIQKLNVCFDAVFNKTFFGKNNCWLTSRRANNAFSLTIFIFKASQAHFFFIIWLPSSRPFCFIRSLMYWLLCSEQYMLFVCCFRSTTVLTLTHTHTQIYRSHCSAYCRDYQKQLLLFLALTNFRLIIQSNAFCFSNSCNSLCLFSHFYSFDDIYEATETDLLLNGFVMNAKHLFFAKTLVNFCLLHLKLLFVIFCFEWL